MTRTHRDLARDNSGAIMVMGVFMAVLLVGFMYYLIGVGETIFYRERMQDAADAGAWAAAVVHARGMNAIVMINMIMAALVAVLLAIKMILFLIDLALVILGIICLNPFGGEWACALLAPLGDVRSTVSDIEQTVEDIVKTVVPILNKVETVIAYATPILAEAKVIKISQAYQPPVNLGLFIPNAIPPMLPVEDDECSVLEDHAKQYLKDLVQAALGPIPVLGTVVSLIIGFVADAAIAVEGSVCGGGGGAGDAATDTARSIGRDRCEQYKRDHGCDGSDDEPDDCGDVDCEEQAASVGGGASTGSSDLGSTDGMAPKKVKDGCNLGAECMQVRSIMIGTPNFDRTMQGVQAGNFGRADGGGGGAYSALQTLARGSVAEAEFYWDINEDGGDGQSARDDWMWKMNWRARLRRFHIPTDSIFGSACSDGGGFCGALTGASDMINSVIVH